MCRVKITAVVALLVLFSYGAASQTESSAPLDYLERLYGVGAIIVSLIIAGFAFFGISNIKDFKDTISQKVTSDLQRSDQAISTLLALTRTAETRITESADKVMALEALITATNEKAELERRLMIKYEDCRGKLLLFDAITSFRGQTPGPNAARRLRDEHLTDLLKTVENSAEEAQSLTVDDDTKYVVFCLFKCQALNRRGHVAIALEELRAQALPRIEKVDRRIKVDIYYNMACYECRTGDLDNSLKDLEMAIYLEDAYKVKAKGDPDFENIKDNPQFISLIESTA